MSAEPFSTVEPERSGSVEVVSGYLASLAIFFSLISLAWHPIRLLAPAMLIALISAGMSGRGKRLPFAAVLTVAACFFLGMMITVITGRPLW
jgi:4-hydroxybenzoate polyprenyltransferase